MSAKERIWMITSTSKSCKGIAREGENNNNNNNNHHAPCPAPVFAHSDLLLP
jgi:hypothetical protein